MTELLRHCQRIAWVLYLLSLVASWPLLPEQVGDPGKAMPRTGYVLLMVLVLAPLPWVMCGGLLRWLRKHPSLLSVPHRAYWLNPARAALSWARMDRQLQVVGALLLVMLSASHYQIVARQQAGWPSLSAQAHELGTVAVLLLMLAYMAVELLQWRVSAADLAADAARASATPSTDARGSRRPRATGARRHGQSH